MEIPLGFEAERRVVGACLVDGSVLEDVVASLKATEFQSVYGVVYRAIIGLHAAGQPVNLRTVVAELAAIPSPRTPGSTLLDEIGGTSVVSAAVSDVDLSETSFWVEEVRRRRKQSQLIEYAEQVKALASTNAKDMQLVMARAEELLLAMTSEDTEDVLPLANSAKLRERIGKYLDDPDAITGLQTGWERFDRQLDGLQPGNVTIVYAPSSRFKSMFVANVGLKLSANGAAGLWFTTEMPALQVQERLLQLCAGLNFRHLRYSGQIDQNRDRIEQAIEELEGLPIYICDSAVVSIGDVKRKVASLKRRHGISYVIVDLVDMVTSSQYQNDSIAQQSAIMRQMKEIAKQSDVHIILVSHVNKSGSSSQSDGFLGPDAMKGSSSKFQDVDCAISLSPVVPAPNGWRPMAIPEIAEATAKNRKMTVLVYVTKNRHGPIGEIPFVIDLSAGGRMYPQEPTDLMKRIQSGELQSYSDVHKYLTENLVKGHANGEAEVLQEHGAVEAVA